MPKNKIHSNTEVIPITWLEGLASAVRHREGNREYGIKLSLDQISQIDLVDYLATLGIQ